MWVCSRCDLSSSSQSNLDFVERHEPSESQLKDFHLSCHSVIHTLLKLYVV